MQKKLFWGMPRAPSSQIGAFKKSQYVEKNVVGHAPKPLVGAFKSDNVEKMFWVVPADPQLSAFKK